MLFKYRSWTNQVLSHRSMVGMILEKLNRQITLCLEHIVIVGLEYLEIHTKETHFT